MKINVYNNNKDIFFEFERNKYELDETDNIISPNTSWLLLKPSKMDPRMNRYKIRPRRNSKNRKNNFENKRYKV